MTCCEAVALSPWVSEEMATDLWYKYLSTEDLDRAFDHILASHPQLPWLSPRRKIKCVW